MHFQTTVFGYSKSEVDNYMMLLEDLASQKDAQIETLERTIRSLQYEKDELEMRASILQELINDKNNDKKSGVPEPKTGCLPERGNND